MLRNRAAFFLPLHDVTALVHHPVPRGHGVAEQPVPDRAHPGRRACDCYTKRVSLVWANSVLTDLGTAQGRTFLFRFFVFLQQGFFKRPPRGFLAKRGPRSFHRHAQALDLARAHRRDRVFVRRDSYDT